MSILMSECKLNREHNHFAQAYSDLMELRLRITAIREHAQLVKSGLAKLCDVDPYAINHLESGKSKAPSALLLMRLAKATKTRPEWIIEEEGETKSRHRSMLARTATEHSLQGREVISAQ